MKDSRELSKMADRLLAKNNYSKDGSPKKTSSYIQKFFEKRIIKTPMGNGSR